MSFFLLRLFNYYLFVDDKIVSNGVDTITKEQNISITEKSEYLKKQFNIDLLEILFSNHEHLYFYCSTIDDNWKLELINGDFRHLGFLNKNFITKQELLEKYELDNEYSEVKGRSKEFEKTKSMLDNINNIDSTRFIIPIKHHQTVWLQFGFDKIGNNLYSGYITNISETQSKNEEIYSISHKDPLTKLFNRVTLEKHFNSINKDHYIIFCFIDLDNFKYFNDEYGHNFGDEVLKKFSSELLNIIEDRFIVYRIGGDEFFIMCNNISKDLFDDKLRLLKSNLESINIDNKVIDINFSYGIVETKDLNYSLDQIYKLTDYSMYKNKKNKT